MEYRNEGMIEDELSSHTLKENELTKKQKRMFVMNCFFLSYHKNQIIMKTNIKENT